MIEVAQNQSNLFEKWHAVEATYFSRRSTETARWYDFSEVSSNRKIKITRLQLKTHILKIYEMAHPAQRTTRRLNVHL